MATQKAEPTESTDTPKKPLLTFAKDLTPSEKLKALADAKKALEDEALAEIDGKIADLEKQLEGLRSERNAILPPRQQNEHPAGKPRTPKKEKVQGKQVNASRLAELVKESGGSLNLRKEGYDIASVRSLVEQSGGKFVFVSTNKSGGKSPWPTVELAK